jgi:gluconolactonase
MSADGEQKILATGLRFPEAPLPMANGDIWFVEVEGGNLACLKTDGSMTRVHLGGGPNGLALGPNGKIYIANNGGFAWIDMGGILVPSHQAEDYAGGRIETYDPVTGTTETLYTHCEGRRISGPNDLVFDAFGGFYFTDTGKSRPHDRDHGGVFYALADGSKIIPVVYPMITPNGIGLSPDGKTLHVAETETARLWAFEIAEPGTITPRQSMTGGRLVIGLGGGSGEHLMIDSLAMTAAGNICLATLLGNRITTVTPEGEIIGTISVPDLFPTNIAFGGADMSTAYITLAATGRLMACKWGEAGLKLQYV